MRKSECVNVNTQKKKSFAILFIVLEYKYVYGLVYTWTIDVIVY